MPAAALDASAPGMPRSMTVTPTPRAARRSATAQPMMPPPMIATSVTLVPGVMTLCSGVLMSSSNPVGGRRGPLQLALEHRRHPYLIAGVDDERAGVGEPSDQ